MNLSPSRPTDEAIKDALLSGKTTLKVCKELKTHTQRIQQVKDKYGLVVKLIPLPTGGCKSFWSEGNIKKKEGRSYRKREEFNGAF